MAGDFLRQGRPLPYGLLMKYRANPRQTVANDLRRARTMWKGRLR